MAAPNMNCRLHLTGVHQKPPASLRNDLDNSLKLKWSMVEKQLIYMNFKHKNTSYMAS